MYYQIYLANCSNCYNKWDTEKQARQENSDFVLNGKNEKTLHDSRMNLYHKIQNRIKEIEKENLKKCIAIPLNDYDSLYLCENCLIEILKDIKNASRTL